jgi:hypothetical protein
MTRAQRKALENHRRRQARKSLVRVEVQAPATDAPLIRAVAETLRGEIRRASDVRARIREALRPAKGSILDRLECALPDKVMDAALRRANDFGRELKL